MDENVGVQLMAQVRDFLIDVTDLCEITGLCLERVRAYFRPAIVKPGRSYHKAKYSLAGSAKVLSEASGFLIEPHELLNHKIIKRSEAITLLASLGKPRSNSLLHNLELRGHGPRVIKLGRISAYFEHELVAWANTLGEPQANGQRRRRAVPKSGAIAATSSAVGSGGGGPESSLPKGGMVLT